MESGPWRCTEIDHCPEYGIMPKATIQIDDIQPIIDSGPCVFLGCFQPLTANGATADDDTCASTVTKVADET